MRRRAADRETTAGPAPHAAGAEPAPARAGPIAPEPFGPLSRRIVLALLAVAAAYLVVRLRSLVMLVVLSGLLAYVLAPAVDLVSQLVFRVLRRPIPRWGAILVVFLAAGALLVTAGLLVVPPLVDQVTA
ncbi:MAG TPA: hypothetical protein VIM86_08555, partial [Thermodesulfobacteriota bacterium]